MMGSKRTTAPVTAGRSRKKQMSWSSRVVLLALALTALFALPGLAQAANPSADLDQCAFGASLRIRRIPLASETDLDIRQHARPWQQPRLLEHHPDVFRTCFLAKADRA